ncbi:uncharacterized protein LAESUDRAFT_413362 [Laetiporus sulphureus 93-53]|uniref:Uncharacterized protein n=1 Tax=Laetiporus sulphureus 93-53 TaxID=1314785 RepID=A0A165C7J2_9APHY|nr:uncharacterized protein LAESUDRAFT_413362 [Laetiporus sulphureus 93-53]KZT02338.1 hypothetical protein LAESUDRAFT_413362 [Laetiporus sulphureus 93-53]
MTSVTSGPIELLEFHIELCLRTLLGQKIIPRSPLLHLSTAGSRLWRFSGFRINEYLLTNCTCEGVDNALYSLEFATVAMSQVVTLLRVYAVTDRDWRPTMTILLLAVAVLGLDIVKDFVNESTGEILLGSTAICYAFPQNSFASTYTK